MSVNSMPVLPRPSQETGYSNLDPTSVLLSPAGLTTAGVQPVNQRKPSRVQSSLPYSNQVPTIPERPTLQPQAQPITSLGNNLNMMDVLIRAEALNRSMDIQLSSQESRQVPIDTNTGRYLTNPGQVISLDQRRQGVDVAAALGNFKLDDRLQKQMNLLTNDKVSAPSRNELNQIRQSNSTEPIKQTMNSSPFRRNRPKRDSIARSPQSGTDTNPRRSSIGPQKKANLEPYKRSPIGRAIKVVDRPKVVIKKKPPVQSRNAATVKTQESEKEVRQYTYQENRLFLQQIQMEIDEVLASQAEFELNKQDVPDQEEQKAMDQKIETIHALREVNELWLSRLSDLNEQFKEVEAKEIQDLIRSQNKQDKLRLKKFCSGDLALSRQHEEHEQALRDLKEAKAEQVRLKSQIYQIQNNEQTVEMMNKCKEIEIDIKALSHKEEKLRELNDYQHRGQVKIETEETDIIEQEINEKKNELMAYKQKFKQLVQFRETQNKNDKVFHEAFTHEKTWNSKFREIAAQMQDEGIDVSEIKFSENNLLLQSPLNRQKQMKNAKPLPIELEEQKNSKPQPKQYDNKNKRELDEADLRRRVQNIQKQSTQIDELRAQIQETSQTLSQVTDSIKQTQIEKIELDKKKLELESTLSPIQKRKQAFDHQRQGKTNLLQSQKYNISRASSVEQMQKLPQTKPRRKSIKIMDQEVFLTQSNEDEDDVDFQDYKELDYSGVDKISTKDLVLKKELPRNKSQMRIEQNKNQYASLQADQRLQKLAQLKNEEISRSIIKGSRGISESNSPRESRLNQTPLRSQQLAPFGSRSGLNLSRLSQSKPKLSEQRKSISINNRNSSLSNKKAGLPPISGDNRYNNIGLKAQKYLKRHPIAVQNPYD